MCINCVNASTGPEICNLFSTYFASVFEPINNNSNNYSEKNDSPSKSNYNLNSINITPEMVLKKLNSLDPNKGPGPDGIPSSFVKTCSKELTAPLCALYNLSVRHGIFPSSWKTAHIIPILKSGNKSDCSNYRPISILCCFSKVFESLIYDALYFQFKPLLADQQHGFVNNKSTLTNLVEYITFIKNTFDDHGETHAIYTDFQKAFDKVNHVILIRKLSGVGVHGNLLRWVTSYINNRSQIVTIKGFKSKAAVMTSGVPQGSLLGPLLFLIFINDLASILKCNSLLYADDLKIFKSIKSNNDCQTLQADLDTLSAWCTENKMSLNVNKCFAMSFTKKKNKIGHSYKINDNLLVTKSSAKDLGIIFDTELSFREHFQYIINRCNKLIGFIFRITKNFKNPRSLILSLELYSNMDLLFGHPFTKIT